MTAEGALNAGATIEPADGESGPLYCYRHPRNETYVRCGRCDQPICPKCAVQGPVGFRCRQCGLVKSATLSSFTPQQLGLGLAASVGGAALLGFISGQIGFFSIFIAFIGGGFIAEAFVRMVGLKRGPLPRAMLYGGMLAGFLLGATLQTAWFLGSAGDGGERFPIELWLQAMAPFLLISIGAAFAGAYSRVRWF